LINPNEISSLANSNGSVCELPNYVDDRLFSIASYDEPFSPTICFFGKMDYQPNIDATVWFCREVMPLLPEHLTLTIVGANISSSLSNRLKSISKRIVIAGFLDDPFPFLSRALALIAPMITGGGIQNKILESMAIGLPVVSSSLAASGLKGAVHGENIFVCQRAEDYAKCILKLLYDKSLRREIGINAQNMARSQFSKISFSKILNTAIESSLKKYSDNWK
jgi:glycosyltransferase involved in cell wall biosynthesis